MRLRTLGGVALEVDGAPVAGGPRRRRLALLALVASAGRRGINRDRVIAILWPDSPSPEARHALSQTLYALRRDLEGKEAIILGPELRIDPTVLETDLEAFAGAVAQRRWAEAASWYRGPFLDGFFLPDVPGFERWVDDERRERAADARTAFEAAAAEATAAGRHVEAVGFWRRLVELDPLAGKFAVGLMEAMTRTGDRAGAVAHAKIHADLVRRELEIEPDPAVTAAVERYRAEMEAQARPVRPLAPGRPSGLDPSAAAPNPLAAVGNPTADAPAVNRRSLVRVGIGLILAVAAIAWAVAMRGGSRHSGPNGTPILAIGDLRDLTAPDSASIGNVLGEVLTTSLGRLTSLEVVASSRMLELLPRGDAPARAARLEAARRAGADEVLEGELNETADGSLRLDLRRVDVESGVVRRGYLATGRDRWAVIDSMTNAIATDLALGTPREPIVARSPVALRLYEDGLRALYQYDTYAAARSFGEAVAADSTFAMAAYYGWWSASLVGDPSAAPLEGLAVRLADRAPTRERLLIRTHVGGSLSEPASLAAAESLATLFPRDPEALSRAATVFAMGGSPLPRITELLDRAIAIDSASRGGRTGPCRLCESFATLTNSYDGIDSIPMVVATLNRWAALQPDHRNPAAAAWMYYLRLGRDEASRRAAARYARLSPDPVDPVGTLLTESIFRDDVAGMDRGCADAFEPTVGERWPRYRWLCAIALRTMGRFRAAFAMATEGRSPMSAARRPDAAPDSLLLATLDFEMGRPLLAAGYFRRAAQALVDSAPPSAARSRQVAWNLTLSATALLAADDTVMAGRLADRVQTEGARSAYVRDPKLHHFIRGLLLARANRHAEAIERYRAAVSSWPLGYTRINYELAGSALALDRPEDAIYPLQAALRGGLEGPQLYLNRTALHERLAEAFDRLGATDSAAFHYGKVARLWKHADPSLAPRLQAARDWLSRHGRPIP